ncbi:hypothetical protein ANANG_G00067110 [Anguilla anguilla]|uniref:Enhancer of polycomb C-terminal domain-containing protein n=1 Tax=Anguilla anguilla TaxID=7936 RepID=A0A9D3S301_ANGAN|nr:hypothetical protein ANANG_G00067110 [Anguilla anguilla]
MVPLLTCPSPCVSRVILDRASSEHDRVLKRLDPDVFASAGDGSDPPARPAASGPLPAAKAGSLAEILENIRTCRWRCFRPRPRPARDAGDDHDDARRGAGRRAAAAPSDRLTGASAAMPNAPKNPPPGGITEEQYHTHQQQLAQMQKQQLAQLRHKPLSQHASPPVRLNAQQVPGPSGRASKTLDSASAHFAASAVISASAPGAPEAGRDPRTHGVNGVLQASGTSKPPHSTSSTAPPPSAPAQLLRAGSAPGAPLSLPGGAHLSNVSAVSPVNLPLVGGPRPLAVRLKAGHRRRHRPGAAPQSHARQRHRRHGQVRPAAAARLRASRVCGENHERERLALNGMSDTTVAMEVT